MTRYVIAAPDGSQHIIEGPDGATPQQIEAFANATFANGVPKTSATGAFLTGLGQSAFGLGDEAEAAVRAAYDAATSDNKFGASYDKNLTDVRQRVADSAKEHPVAYYGGEIGGSLAVPGGLAKLGIQSGIRAAANQGLRAAVTQGAKEGAAYGAAYGFGKGEGGLQNRAEGAVGGAAMGGAVGGAAPVAINAVRAAVEPVANAVRSVTHPTHEAARRVREALAADAATGASTDAILGVQNGTARRDAAALIAQGRAGQEVRNIDTGGEGTRALARSAANQSPEAREMLARMTNDRFEGQTDRTTDFMRGLIQTPGNSATSRDLMRITAQAENNANYGAARAAGDRPIITPEIERLTGSPMMRDAMQRAAKTGQDRAIAEGGGAFNPGVEIDPSGLIRWNKGPSGVTTYPNLQYWDYVKRELDDIATSARNSGDYGRSGVAGDMARTLRRELDSQVPEYVQARGIAEVHFGARDAIDAGEKLAMGSINADNNALRSAFRKMGPGERAAFQEGYVSRYITNIQNSPDRRNLVARLANSPGERERLSIVLGPNKARELEAFLHIEQLMDLPRTALGNSTTARQLMELGLAGGAGMIAGGGNPLDPHAIIVGALTYGAKRGQTALGSRMAQRIAEMLVSKDPQVLQRGVRTVAVHGQTMDALRSLSNLIATGYPAAAGGAVGGAMAQQEQRR